jgi:hypothetical protein
MCKKKIVLNVGEKNGQKKKRGKKEVSHYIPEVTLFYLSSLQDIIVKLLFSPSFFFFINHLLLLQITHATNTGIIEKLFIIDSTHV